MSEPCDFETAIEQTGFGRFNITLLLSAFVTILVCMMDTTTMAYILPQVQCDLNLCTMGKGSLNAITYAGLISSSFLWGYVSDIIGRIKLLRFCLLVDGIFAFCSAFSQSLWMLLTFRYLVGFMSCTMLPLTMTSVAEFHGLKYRSRCVVAVGFYLGLTQVILPAIGLFLLTKTFEVDMGAMKLHPWNAFVVLCSLPALMGSVIFSFFPETPKFLMAHGRNEEALAVMRRIYAANKGAPPDTFPVANLVEETPAKDHEDTFKVLFSKVMGGCSQILPLFSLPYLPYTALVLFIQASGLMSLNTIRLWLPSLFTELEDFYQLMERQGNTTDFYMCDALTARRLHWERFSKGVPPPALGSAADSTTAAADVCQPVMVNDRIFINSMIVCSFATVAVGCSSFLVKQFGYRKLIIACCLLSSVFSMSVLWSTHWIETVLIFCMYMSAVNINNCCVLGAVVSIFPTQFRATAVSLTMMSGYTSALVGNLLFPSLMELRCEYPFYVITCCQVAAGLAAIALPCTYQQALA